ncbi:MAG: TIGR03435 family protein [Acidobacteriota bacterium]|nr:TIGR03435 family protein [Acidobacteriota bacterium]
MRNRLAMVVIACGLIPAGAAFGQTAAVVTAADGAKAAAAVPVFEVASVRPAAPIDQMTIFAGLRAGKRPEEMHIDGQRATFKYMSLKQLVAYGYKVRPYQVSGPDWMTTDRFDIAAKLPDGATRDDVPAMTQALLVERFKLAAHLETKEHPVLGLMLAKGGSKMKEVPAAAAVDESAELKPGQTKVDSVDGPMILTRNVDGSTTYNMGARGKMTLRVDGQTGTMQLEGSSMSMKGLAMMMTTLGGGSGRQVVDQTGLKGNYEVTVSFALSELVSSLRDSGIDIPGAPPPSGGDPAGDSTIADALGKLGLKMQGTKADVEQLVIDHVEKAATEN